MKPFAKINGFSLLEMMVALAILGASLGVIYHSTGLSSRILGLEKDHAYALMLAQSLLADVPLSEDTPQTGDLGKYTYQWDMFPLSEHPLDEQYRLVMLEVNVSWPIGLNRRDITLYTVVPAR